MYFHFKNGGLDELATAGLETQWAWLGGGPGTSFLIPREASRINIYTTTNHVKTKEKKQGMEQAIQMVKDGMLEPVGSLQRAHELLLRDGFRYPGADRASQWPKQRDLEKQTMDNK